MKKLLLLSPLLVLLLIATAQAKFDPSFVWTTIETPHFLIHYHQGGDEIAKRTAVIAEDVHRRLAPRIGWEPKERTHLVLVDAMDEANGMTSPIPYNHIVLFLTRPGGQPGFGTNAWDDWLRLLITHEYTHLLHLDMVNGPMRVLQAIFGRIYFPNLFEPVWMIEGLATYEETEQTAGGRGRSPGAEMVLRMAVLEDRFPRLDQAAVFLDSWPAGQIPYLFGESFTRYIADKYGRDKLAEISRSYSRNGIPWFVDLNGRRVLGQWYSDLWTDWQQELTKRYAAIRVEVASRGLTTSRPLTDRGYKNTDPAFSPDGKRIAYSVVNADEFPSIRIMEADGTGDRMVVENVAPASASGGSIAWSADGARIYYTKIELWKNTNYYADLYAFDLQKKRELRLTEDLRARDPFPSADGKQLLFVANKLGRTRLGTISLTGPLPARDKDVAWLTDWSDLQYETPRSSPDGREIVVSVRQPDGFKDIWILDQSGRKTGELMHDRALDGNAVWSADGRTILFTSDRSGIFNIYAFDRKTGTVSQLTNVLGGAFTPALSPDGSLLVYASYSSRGFDLHQQPATAAPSVSLPAPDRYPAIAYNEQPVTTASAAYDPLPTLLPRFWIPWYGYSEASRDLFGFLTFGQDVIERHSWLATGLYSPKTYRTWYAASYAYDGLYPTITASASDTDRTFTDLLSDLSATRDYVQRERSIGVSVLFPLYHVGSQHALKLDYERTKISALTDLPPWPGYSGPVPAEGTLGAGRIRYVYNSAKEYGFSISPEDGRTLDLGHERLGRGFGSDFSVSKYTADWREYLGLPFPHQVLLARVFYGTSRGDVLPQRAFQLGGDDPGNATIPVATEDVHLRGYPVSAFRGQKAGLATLEYRFPIRNLERGWSSTPFFLRRLHGAVFVEAGNAWDNGYHHGDLKRSIGAELRLDTNLSYYLPVTFRLVAAKGLDEKGESSAYFSLWLPGLL